MSSTRFSRRVDAPRASSPEPDELGWKTSLGKLAALVEGSPRP